METKIQKLEVNDILCKPHLSLILGCSQVFAKHFSLSRDVRLNRTLASAALHKTTYMKKDKQVK